VKPETRIQGFHDIATVLQLTLPPEVAFHTLEKLSLHRLRDSMGHTLEPLTGLMTCASRSSFCTDSSTHHMSQHFATAFATCGSALRHCTRGVSVSTKRGAVSSLQEVTVDIPLFHMQLFLIFSPYSHTPRQPFRSSSTYLTTFSLVHR
jgi:hypothetical protein